MPRVVPSQVVELIDQIYPQVRTSGRQNLPSGPEATAVVKLAKEIPSELLTLSGQDLSDYFVSLSLIEGTEQGRLALQHGSPVPEHRGLSTIFLLRKALSKCRDEVPAPETTELLFVSDDALRDSIRRDISAANQGMI